MRDNFCEIPDCKHQDPLVQSRTIVQDVTVEPVKAKKKRAEDLVKDSLTQIQATKKIVGDLKAKQGSQELVGGLAKIIKETIDAFMSSHQNENNRKDLPFAKLQNASELATALNITSFEQVCSLTVRQSVGLVNAVFLYGYQYSSAHMLQFQNMAPARLTTHSKTLECTSLVCALLGIARPTPKVLLKAPPITRKKTSAKHKKKSRSQMKYLNFQELLATEAINEELQAAQISGQFFAFLADRKKRNVLGSKAGLLATPLKRSSVFPNRDD